MMDDKNLERFVVERTAYLISTPTCHSREGENDKSEGPYVIPGPAQREPVIRDGPQKYPPFHRVERPGHNSRRRFATSNTILNDLGILFY